MADTEKKETRGGDEVIKKSTVTPSGNENLGKIENKSKNKSETTNETAETTKKTVLPNAAFDPYGAEDDEYDGLVSRAEIQDFIQKKEAEKRQKANSTKPSEAVIKGASGAEFTPNALNDYQRTENKTLDKISSGNAVPDTAFGTRNVNDFSNLPAQTVTNEDPEAVMESMRERISEQERQIALEKAYRDYLLNPVKNDVAAKNKAAREEFAADAPKAELKDTHIKGSPDLRGDSLIENLVSDNGTISPGLLRLFKRQEKGNLNLGDLSPKDAKALDMLNAAVDRLKNTPYDELTPAGKVVLEAAGIGGMNDFKREKLSDQEGYNEANSGFESAKKKLKELQAALKKYAEEHDPTFSKAKSFRIGENTYGIKGYGHNLIAKLEYDPVTNEPQMVVRLARNKLAQGDIDAARKKFGKDAAGFFAATRHADTKIRPVMTIPLPEGVTEDSPEWRDALQKAMNFTEDVGQSDTKLSERRARGQTRRSADYQLQQFLKKFVVGMNLNNADSLNGLRKHLKGLNVNPEAVDTDDKLRNVLRNLIGSARNPDGNLIYAIDDRNGDVKLLDEVPEEFRALSDDEVRRIAGSMAARERMYTESGELRPGVTLNEEGNPVQNLGSDGIVSIMQGKDGKETTVRQHTDKDGNVVESRKTVKRGMQDVKHDPISNAIYDIMDVAKQLSILVPNSQDRLQKEAMLSRRLAELYAKARKNGRNEVTDRDRERAVNDIALWSGRKKKQQNIDISSPFSSNILEAFLK